jgi:hypothetical protein
MVGGKVTSVATAAIVLFTAKEKVHQGILRGVGPNFAAGRCPDE